LQKLRRSLEEQICQNSLIRKFVLIKTVISLSDEKYMFRQ
jgi:hypothetical protein